MIRMLQLKATEQLRNITGDQDLYVARGIYGYSMRDIRYVRQRGEVFRTVDQLLQAAGRGERPEEVRESEVV